ncbi:MAG: hypothetical protein N2712_06945 [Brevinematales bacterium]|nr:hypothetical protein [Brevinematales bacterium]
MSKFPSPENFKNHKTKPQEFIENFIHYPNYLLSKNILPRKFKRCYIYDIMEQKFVDFFLDYGKYYLGFSDKYLTKMTKNYLKTTILSYTNGIFTYRFLKLLREIFEFNTIMLTRDIENLNHLIQEVINDEIIVNSEFLLTQIRKSKLSKKPNVSEPFDEILNYSEIPKTTNLLFLGRGIRYPQILKTLNNLDIEHVVLGLGRFFILLSRTKIQNHPLSRITEFDAMFGYYYLLREKFLIENKLSELKKLSKRWLSKFVELGTADDISPYCIKIKNSAEELNIKLLQEGIITKGNILFFSYQHEENDFRRLRRKLNHFLTYTNSSKF